MPNKVQNTTVRIGKDEVVTTEAKPFLLHDADFLRLTKLRSFISIWAHSFFAGTGIFLVTLAAKFVDHRYYRGTEDVTAREWITFWILAVLVLVFEGLHLLLPSDRKKTIAKIKKHFADNC